MNQICTVNSESDFQGGQWIRFVWWTVNQIFKVDSESDFHGGQ